ncbi:hypothetical protein [Clostridium perfringens]|uniref:hypothetical protein n=1 Tax=Clostridium perfringens TaxID=1502 RepID=UPI001E63466B|nr:hypothetical protein [Clostridium perfringens]WVL78290.1 hypothetical protein LMS42_015110 [Clostridium perfringens]
MFKYKDKEFIVKPIIRGEARFSTKRYRLNEILRECDEGTRINIIDDIRHCIKQYPIQVGESLRTKFILFVKFVCLEDGSEMIVRTGCPNIVLLDDDCGLSCEDCWSRAIGIFLSEENKRDVANACSESGIELITKFKTREEKIEFLNNLKEVKHINCQDANMFKVKEKTYSMCPIDAGLESNFDIRNSCRFNCSECTKCWNRNIKDFLEDEE